MASGPLSIFPRDAQAEENRQLIGPFFIGIILNYLLWGIQISQTYYYYNSYRKTDRVFFKAAVALLFLVDVAQSMCVTEGVWHFVVDGWGDPSAVIEPLSRGFLVITILDAITASIVHIMYAQKIWMLLRSPYNYIGTGIVLLLSLLQLAGGIGCTSLALAIDVTLVTFGRIKTWSCVWLVSASVTDIAISSIMTWRLSQSRTGFKRTDDIISKLIRMTIETGLAPAVTQILDLIVFLIWPAKSFHVTLTLLNPKVYSNSMMALLNSRLAQREEPSKVWTSSTTQGDTIQIRTTQAKIADDIELTENTKGQLSPMGHQM